MLLQLELILIYLNIKLSCDDGVYFTNNVWGNYRIWACKNCKNKQIPPTDTHISIFAPFLFCFHLSFHWRSCCVVLRCSAFSLFPAVIHSLWERVALNGPPNGPPNASPKVHNWNLHSVPQRLFWVTRNIRWDATMSPFIHFCQREHCICFTDLTDEGKWKCFVFRSLLSLVMLFYRCCVLGCLWRKPRNSLFILAESPWQDAIFSLDVISFWEL